MADEPEPPQDVLAYLQALGSVLPPTLSAPGLLRGAWRSGILHAAAEDRTVDELAEATGTEPARARALADALVAFEVLDREGERYRVSETWRPILLPSPPLPVDRRLDLVAATDRLLELAAAGGATYWTGDDDARLAMALGVSPDPEAPSSLRLNEFMSHHDPDLREQLEAGGRYLELGCGVAGSMCTTLQVFPEVTAVGVELDEQLVAFAQARVERLGLADRVTIVCADVRDFTDPAPFDFAFWSQFFFAEDSRAAALDVAFDALRPGGVVSAPLLDEPVSDVDALRTAEGREAALDTLLFRSWGIPHRSAEELSAEMTTAGFVDVRHLELGFVRIVRATRP